MRQKHINTTTYDDFERLDSFAGEMEKYRRSKLKSAEGHVGFIKRLFPKKRISVLELGSGNSKTLFALEKAGVLEKGYGLEVSKSRYKFAELWKKEWGFTRVENRNVDVLKVDFQRYGNFDLCFCVDLAFQFFEPIERGSALRVLKSMYKQLIPGGKIVLELDGCERILSRMRNGTVRLWEEFAPADPWQYSLWDCSLDPKNNFMHWRKVFIKRNEFGRSENEAVLGLYKMDGIKKLLKEAGFSKIGFYGDWTEKEFRADTGEYIIVGIK